MKLPILFAAAILATLALTACSSQRDSTIQCPSAKQLLKIDSINNGDVIRGFTARWEGYEFYNNQGVITSASISPTGPLCKKTCNPNETVNNRNESCKSCNSPVVVVAGPKKLTGPKIENGTCIYNETDNLGSSRLHLTPKK